MSDASLGRTATGSRRFWLTVAAFALANTLVWIGFIHWSHRNLKLVHIVNFEPGRDAVTNRRPTLRWEFNLDMAHDVKNAATPGRIIPAIPGNWAWKGERLLTFTPDGDLPPATKFVVTLNSERVHTADGLRLDQEFHESFTTTPLQLESARQISWTQQNELILELQFNDVVSPVLCLQHVKVTDPTGRAVTCQLQGQAAGKIVRVQTEPLPELEHEQKNQFVNLALTSGMVGAGGPLSMAQTASRKIDVAVDLMATGLNGSSSAQDEGTISLQFNNDVDPDSIQRILSVEPTTPFTISSGGQQVELTGAFQPGSRYVVKLAAPPAGADQRKFPRADVLSVFMPDRPARLWFDHAAGYLGTNGNRTVLVHAVNVAQAQLTVTRMYDNNLVSWRNTGGDQNEQLSRPIVTQVLKTSNTKNQQRDIAISLDDLLPPSASRDGVYQLSLAAEQASSRSEDGDNAPEIEFNARGSNQCVVTFSDIGLTARRSPDVIDVWAVSLRSAKPLGGVEVRVFSDKNQLLGEGRSDTNGLVHIASIHPVEGERPAILIAEMADNARLAGEAIPAAAMASPGRGLTWLDLNQSNLNFASADVGGKPYLRQGFQAFVYTERGVYRPGETAHLRAIVRGPNLSTPGTFPIKWQLRRPDLCDWQSSMAKLDANGNVSLDIPLPSDLPTGRWTAELQMPSPHGEKPTVFGSVAFEVQEFMPNRMKIALDIAPRTAGKNGRVSMSSGPVRCSIQADYLFGEPAVDRPVTLATRVDPADFTPAQWENWTFGDNANSDEVLHEKEALGGRAELTGKNLDAKGHTIWEFKREDLPMSKSGRFRGPWQVSFFASVIDTGGRAVNTSQSAQLDEVPWYLGLRTTSSSAKPNTPVSLELAAVIPDGATSNSATTVKVQLYREQWNTTLVKNKGSWEYVSTRKFDPIGDAQSITLAGGRGHCEVVPPSAGQFVAVAQDTTTGFVTSIYLSSYTASWEDNVNREDPQGLQITLAPPAQSAWQLAITNLKHPTARTLQSLWLHGRLPAPVAPKTWHAGDAAQVIVRAPFAGTLLLGMETDSVLSSQVIAMPHSQIAVPITIPSNCRPNGFVTATVVRAIDPNAKWQTHRAFGITRLVIDPADQKLNVRLDAPAQVRPDNTLTVRVRLTDSQGNPAAGAAVTVAAVDEGILALTNYHTPDPLNFFTALCAHGVPWSDLYNDLLPEVPQPRGSSPTGGDRDAQPSASRHQTPVTAHRVKPVALVSGLLHSDAEGWCQADFSIPDFSGQLRLMAIANHATSLGSGQSEVLVRGPFMVQSNWPRFAAPNDRFNVPLTIFNFTGKPGKAQITAEITDGNSALQLGNAHELRWQTESSEVANGGTGEISLPVSVRTMAGIAHVHLTATLNQQSWQESIELPVRPASPEISVGGYATATPATPTTLPIATSQMLQGTARLQINVAPLPALQLPEGLQYLDQYPYGCAEQTVSGCLPLIALNDLGTQMAPAIFSPQRIDEKLQSGILHLIGMQTADGGLSMWQGTNQPTWPWASVYAAHFVIEAEHAGHKVPADFCTSLLGYVRSLLDHATDDAATVEAQCYGCYVLALAGEAPRNAMSRLTDLVNSPWSTQPDRAAPSVDCRFHLAAAWMAAGRRDLAEALIPAKLPSPETKRQRSGNLASPIKDRSILLSTLLDVQPNNPAIPAIAQEIADAGRAHHWESTQDTALAVMALGKYLRQAKTPPAYRSAAALLDGQSLGQSTPDEPLTIERRLTKSPDALKVQVDGPDQSIAYVSWLLSGVPLKPPADEDSGLVVRRAYLDTDGKPIKGDHLRTGDLIQVELTLSSPTPLEHVVIDDLLPAGLEIENARLATSAKKGEQAAETASGITAPFENIHIDVRDDRMILVGDFAGGKPARFVYLARGLTPGVFTLPPVRAECMYDIGTHSIFGGARTLTVDPLNRPVMAFGGNP